LADVKEPILKAYFDRLTKLGKIDTTVYTMERLLKDLDDYLIPACVVYFCKMNLICNLQQLHSPTANLKAHCELPQTKENILAALFSDVTILQKDRADDFEI
jgi:hypothetical protein